MEEYKDVFLENFNYYATAHKGVNCDVSVQSGVDLRQATLRPICTTTDETAQLK